LQVNVAGRIEQPAWVSASAMASRLGGVRVGLRPPGTGSLVSAASLSGSTGSVSNEPSPGFGSHSAIALISSSK
jgi:hypothetical protein